MAGGAIPLEILNHGILPRLPAKSVIRFKCVSKAWLSLISSNEFIQLHLSYLGNNNDLLILTGNDSCLYSFNLNLPSEAAVKLKMPTSFEPQVVGSCNGLLCIQTHRPYSLALLNPSTHSYRTIPCLLPPRRCSALNFGFGYDSSNHDYKILRIADRYSSLGFLTHQLDRIVHLFSLSNNSWELIDCTSPLSTMGLGLPQNGALVNQNLLHWKFWYSQQRKSRIHCFNLSEKQWTHDVLLPHLFSVSSNDHDDTQDGVLDFGVLDGSLYLSTKNHQQSAIDIWVMIEYGVQDSWVKLFQISDSRVFRSLRVSPLAYTTLKHRIWLTTVDKTHHKILWYDIKGQSTESAEINGVQQSFWIVATKGSLVSVPGGFQIGTTKEKGYPD